MARSIRWVWLGPVAFLVHDAEEVLAFEPWVRAHRAALPAVVRPLLESVSTRQFGAAVLALFAGYLVVSALAVPALRAGRRPWPFLVVTGVFVGNGLTHLLQAVALGGYTPGVVTAAAVNLPYGWAAGRALLADAAVSRRVLLVLVALGAVLQVPIAWLALQLGRHSAAP